MVDEIHIMEENDLIKMGIVKVGKVETISARSKRKVYSAVWNILITILVTATILFMIVIGIIRHKYGVTGQF